MDKQRMDEISTVVLKCILQEEVTPSECHNWFSFSKIARVSNIDIEEIREYFGALARDAVYESRPNNSSKKPQRQIRTRSLGKVNTS